MSFRVINQANNKIKASDKMYSEWSSLSLEGGGQGVLGAVGGRDVVLAVVKQLALPEPSPLKTDAEVEWVLEVVRYGLALPLSEHEAVRDCVRVCCAWLGPLLPPAPPAQPPPPAIPQPVLAAPAHYAAKILSHLHNLFIPRADESGDLISKQAVLCHRVLRLARSLADGGGLSAREWRHLLQLLLAAAAALLAPPAPHHPAADQLCERVLCVLFEVWIIACHRCFPTPPLWRTLREQCVRWRHRAPLVEQWARASLCLTARLLTHMYGPAFPAMPISEEDASLVPADMSGEAVIQSWYRILHTIGNPVDLCRPHVISQTPDFLQYSMTQEDGNTDPSQHPCLLALPSIFHKAMRGVAAHVDAFLGYGSGRWEVFAVSGAGPEQSGGGINDETTPPAHRRLAKSFSVASKPKDKMADKGTPRSSLIGLASGRSSALSVAPPSAISTIASDMERCQLAPLRPKVDSIFHLFGEWLFEAALISSVPALNNQQHVDGTPPPFAAPNPTDVAYKLNMMNYQPGRAEATGALCRVLCSKAWGERVHAAHLARCYAAVRRALRDPHSPAAASVVINAHDIFRLDLDGVLVLVPDFITTLDRVLSEREPKLECGSIDNNELRKAAISCLLSLVAIPHHYKGLAIPEFPGCNEFNGATFGEYARGRISQLCVAGVQAEACGARAARLLGALYLCAAHGDAPAARADRTGHAKVRSEGGSTDEHGSLEDFAADVKELDPSSPHFGAAFVVRATYLVCHRLISSWKGDVQVSLAALEVLSGLAKLHTSRPEGCERSRAVRWLCDYIAAQCARPPPAHSRDAHSCVVAAYWCIGAWLSPALLDDPRARDRLLEVVELGLSGATSRGKPGDPPKMKDDKELKPVSMRVRDAAESLLMLILEQAGSRRSWWRMEESRAVGGARARHLLADGGTLLSLIEEPLANCQETHPTLVVVIRSAWGRYAWALGARGGARSARRGGGACARPVAISEPPPRAPPLCRPLPAHPLPATDSAFPSIDAVLRQLNDPEASVLFKLLEQQAIFEKKIRDNHDNVVPEEYIPPEPVTEFQTARLFLSHFGYLDIGEEKPSEPRLVSLTSSPADWSAAMRRLDTCSPRAAATAHVFCARAGQRRAADVVANARRADSVPAAFLKLLNGLGRVVSVRGHDGWTGRADTSYGAHVPDSHAAHAEHAPSCCDGREQVIYWSDSMNEIAFVVPSGLEPGNEEEQNDSIKSDVDGCCFSTRSSEKSGDWWSDAGGGAKPPSRALSLELDRHSAGNSSITGSGRRNKDFAVNILIIWLEDFDDYQYMPIEDLVRYCDTGEPTLGVRETRVIACGALRSGLVRVRVDSGTAPSTLPHGSLVTPSRAPRALRRAALELARRARLDTDLYQPPHVRRRHIIQEIGQQFKRDLTEPELLESLFYPPD